MRNVTTTGIPDYAKDRDRGPNPRYSNTMLVERTMAITADTERLTMLNAQVSDSLHSPLQGINVVNTFSGTTTA